MLWCQRSIPVLDSPPSPIRFLRDFVALSRPCIIRNAVADKDGNPLTLTLEDLRPDVKLTVDITPDGHGDCIRLVGDGNDKSKQIFVQPEQRNVTVAAFRQHLRRGREPHANSGHDHRQRIFQTCLYSEEGDVTSDTLDDKAVLYYSRQNDCFRQELAFLWDSLDFPDTFPWAEEAFDTGRPDAVNLWIGDERAVSSMHKDHYENLFYVLSGEKIFTLCPPADAPFLYERQHKSGRFDSSNGSWKVRLDKPNEEVQWIAADVTKKDDREYLQKFPLLRYTHPIEVRVQAGELLYLPSLWFHRVTQSCETLGVNWWYDMRFDSPGWIYFHLLQQLRPLASEDGAPDS